MNLGTVNEKFKIQHKHLSPSMEDMSAARKSKKKSMSIPAVIPDAREQENVGLKSRAPKPMEVR
jgi:hypothetical protein